MLRRMRIPAAISLGLLALAGAAVTAANTVPATSAGEGSAAVSGYTITNITYNLNGGTPSNVDTVTFTATADNGSTATALTTIKVEFDSGTGYYDCTRTGGVAPASNISCDTTAPQLTVANTDIFNSIIIE